MHSFERFCKFVSCILWAQIRVGRLTTDPCKHTKKPNSHKQGDLWLHYVPLRQYHPGKKHLPSNNGEGKQQWVMGSGSPGTWTLMSRFSLFGFHFFILFYFFISSVGSRVSALVVKLVQQAPSAHWVISPAISLDFDDTFLIGLFFF